LYLFLVILKNICRFIDNPNDEFDPKSFPSIRKKFNLDDIKTSVLNLHTVAKQLRNKRFENGCLTLNQAKLNFIINKDSGMPYAYNVYQQKDSNRSVKLSNF
jgi:DIS3-like exonuclease 2